MSNKHNSSELIFKQAAILGKYKVIDNLLNEGVDSKLSDDEISTIINNKDKKMLSLLIKKSKYININNELLVECFYKKWKKVYCDYLNIADCQSVNITDNKFIIKIISMGNEFISGKILASKDLDIYGENEEVMVYLCKTNNVKLIEFLCLRKNIDFSHNSYMFVKVAVMSYSTETVEYIGKQPTFAPPRNVQKYLYIRSKNVGI